jgi:hypothetical protein
MRGAHGPGRQGDGGGVSKHDFLKDGKYWTMFAARNDPAKRKVITQGKGGVERWGTGPQQGGELPSALPCPSPTK